MHLDVNRVEVLPELFTLSLNFKEPIGVLVADETPYTVTGIVESIDEKSVVMEGKRIRLRDVIGIGREVG